MKEKQVSKYIISLDDYIIVEDIQEKHFHAIIFEIKGIRYEIMQNYLLGDRLLMNDQYGWHKDVPFKPATFHLLPENITVREI